MFICRPCLENNYYNFGQFTSFGICEQCGKHSYCHDIPSGNLNPKQIKHDFRDIKELLDPKSKLGLMVMGYDTNGELISRPKSELDPESLKIFNREMLFPGGSASPMKEYFQTRTLHDIKNMNEIAYTIKQLHDLTNKNKPMISNEDHSTEKSPWRWLWHGDKAWFVPAFFLFTCLATWVSMEYEWVVPALTLLFFGSITIGLVIYRVLDYKALVKSMDILSFSDWAEFKKIH